MARITYKIEVSVSDDTGMTDKEAVDYIRGMLESIVFTGLELEEDVDLGAIWLSNLMKLRR